MQIPDCSFHAQETGGSAVLPPQFCGSAAYYAVMSSYPRVYIHNAMRFDKRFKSTHRTVIADTRGRLELTVPVAKPHGIADATWRDAVVSAHGEWWNLFVTALESAYGRTPYYEFYADDFAPVFSRDVCGMSVTDLDMMADGIIRRLAGINTEVIYTDSSGMPQEADDLRRADFASLGEVRPYWQVRADTLGFIPCLSILDLLFSVGPETPLYLGLKASGRAE